MKSKRPARKPSPKARAPVEPTAPAAAPVPAVSASLLDRDFAHALDPAALFESAIGGLPDPWQAALLRSEARRTLVLCSRQSGKSTTAALLAYHEALYRPPALVLLAAPSQRQSQELFRKVLAVHAAVGESAPPVEAESALRLELRNGSRIVALPGLADTVRGFSNVRLLILDEAARIDDALVAAVRPMLAVSRGRLLALTTPNGKQGWYYDAWTGGGAGWERIRVTAADCPRISAEFLAEEKGALGPALYAQEYGTEFREAAGQLFAEETIASLSDSGVEPLFADDPEWVLPLGPVIEAKRLDAPAEPSLIFDDAPGLPALSKEP